VRLEADFRAVSHMGDRVVLSLAVERLGGRSITLKLRCAGDEGDTRMELRQVLVTTSLVTHRAIDIPPDLRAAIMHGPGIAP
jgi:4-hydroxybenzoyl-CoA thioesterase